MTRRKGRTERGEGMDDTTHIISSGDVSATIKAEGAELISLRNRGGDELLWQAGEAWPRHAPVLFPVVGRLANDTLHHRGRDYRITQHGFARDCLFDWSERTENRAVLTLHDESSTRAVFPFAFRLDLIYVAEGDTLSVTSRVGNPGDATLFCGIGAHPGFRWPLADDVAKSDHRIVFDKRETGPALGVEDGLLGTDKALPFDGTTLPLTEALFADDALVMPGVTSRSVRYEALGADGAPVRSLTVAWEGYKDLGIWSKPGGAPFVCIEPWYSMASPVGFDGAFASKPGILSLEPGESRDFTWSVSLAEA